MSVRISQAEDRSTGQTSLRVEGSLTGEAVELLENLCLNLLKQPETSVVINLGEVDFLNEDAARLLCRLKREQGISLEGCRLFTRQVIEDMNAS